jgi:MFS family permease
MIKGVTAPLPSENSSSPARREQARFAAFAYRNFTLFWTSLVVSNVGTWMQNVALGWWVVHINRSPLAVGLLGASQGIPMILLPPLGGAVADRLNRLLVLKFTQMTMGLTAAAMAVVIAGGHATLWEVLLINAVSSVALAFDNPARQALVADLVDRPAVMSAVSLFSTTYAGAQAVGPAIAGILIPFIGIAGCLYVNAVSFLAVIVALFLMRVPHVRPADLQPVWRELSTGFSYIRRTPLVFTLLTFSISTSLFGRSYSVLMPVFAKEILHTGAAGYGGMQAMPGIGTFIGGFGLAALGDVKRKGRLLLGLCLSFVFLVIGFSLSRSYAASLALLIGVGAMSTTVQAVTMTILQLEIPQRIRGRVLSLNAVSTIGMSNFAGLLIGALATGIGTPLAVALGALLLGVIAVGLYSTQPQLRRYRTSYAPTVSPA